MNQIKGIESKTPCWLQCEYKRNSADAQSVWKTVRDINAVCVTSVTGMSLLNDLKMFEMIGGLKSPDATVCFRLAFQAATEPEGLRMTSGEC